MKPGCPNCGSLQARPHCHPANMSEYTGPRERKMTSNPCPWFQCLACDRFYDSAGRSMQRRVDPA